MLTNIAAYQFVPVDDPDDLAARVQATAAALALRGTVLVAGEGINLFLVGEDAAIATFVDGLRRDARFADIRVKASRSESQPFARLKVKVKPEIISFRRDQASPWQGRAASVAPIDLARWIVQGHDDAGRRLLLLDARNREEVAHGTFANALTLPIDRFSDLPAAIELHRAGMADATVVSFCTGGIRCEKAALWLQSEGMDNVLQLDGGILGYFEAVGGAGYVGACFVFDERIALDASLQPVQAVAAVAPVLSQAGA